MSKKVQEVTVEVPRRELPQVIEAIRKISGRYEFVGDLRVKIVDIKRAFASALGTVMEAREDLQKFYAEEGEDMPKQGTEEWGKYQDAHDELVDGDQEVTFTPLTWEELQSAKDSEQEGDGPKTWPDALDPLIAYRVVLRPSESPTEDEQEPETVEAEA